MLLLQVERKRGAVACVPASLLIELRILLFLAARLGTQALLPARVRMRRISHASLRTA